MTDATVLQPSACDNIPRPRGVGFVPLPGSRSRLYTLPNGQGTSISHPMDLGAHGFGDTAVYSMEAQRARYGPNFHGTDEHYPRFLALDFESLFGVGSIYLSKLACENRFGTAHTLSCYPTYEELHDFYACNPEEASRALGVSGAATGGSQPGIPVITSLVSPGRGRVYVFFRSALKGHSTYEIGIWRSQLDAIDLLSTPVASVPLQGELVASPGSKVREQFITLPIGLGGVIAVRVRAFLGAQAGRWSTIKTVEVEPRLEAPSGSGGPSGPTPPVEPPIVPPITPNPPVDPPAPPASAYRVFMIRFPVSPVSGQVSEIKEVEAGRWNQ